MDFIFTRVMMLILVNLLISVLLRIQWTLHGILEFRYGSDLDALGQYDAGDYAYWLAAGISTDYTQEILKTHPAFLYRKIYLKRNK